MATPVDTNKNDDDIFSDFRTTGGAKVVISGITYADGTSYKDDNKDGINDSFQTGYEGETDAEASIKRNSTMSPELVAQQKELETTANEFRISEQWIFFNGKCN